jgi:cob(I)alamin adenosyltransferase
MPKKKPSIATRQGDRGNTSLMYGRRVPKDNLRVEAYGAVDELNASLGLVRASIKDKAFKETLLKLQKDMFAISLELATTLYDEVNLPKERICEEHIAFLDKILNNLESNYDFTREWAIPGDNFNSALLDLSRTICRRAERNVVTLEYNELLTNKTIITYLNRLSDILWLWARKEALSSKGFSIL